MDDATATRACLTGNVDAFRHFVDRYQSRALAHAWLLTRNESDAADATQDAFVDAFRNLSTFDPGRLFYGWFYVLLRNRCFKQRSRRATRWESEILPESGVAPGLSDEHLDLWRAIDRLTSQDAELIVLKHIEGWTYEELSASLGLPRGTVMSRLYAARQRLLTMLSGERS
jgi:RNA polymerase sigma-70 factor (ECF subfamily)